MGAYLIMQEIPDEKQLLRIMGLDPSLNNFGMCFGLLDLSEGSLSCVKVHLSELPKGTKNKTVRKNSIDLDKAQFHIENLYTFIQYYKPDVICVEIPVGSQSARSMASYGICIGILASITLPMIQVTAMEVKKAGTGNKNATKSDMIKWATEAYPKADWLTHGGRITDKNEHCADALGAIYAGVKTDQFKLITSLRK